MREAKAFNIDVRPPDISKSKFTAQIEDINTNSIRMGLNCIKGLGEAGATDIMNAQPFSTIQEFFEKTGGTGHNKKNVEVSIKIGAFENLPLEICKDLVTDEMRELFKIEDKEDKCWIYMNRSQQKRWFELYQDIASKKSIPNYLIDITTVAGKYLNEFNEGELVTEKKNPNCVVVPEPQLERFGKTINEVEKTRCKPKGVFEKVKEDIKDKFVHAFIKNMKEISEIKFSAIKCYLEDLDAFEISFVKHPFDGAKRIQTIGDKKDGAQVELAGIIKDVTERKSKKGNTYYYITLITPLELVGIRMWNNMYRNASHILEKGRLLVISGSKGFGAVTAEELDIKLVEKLNNKFLGD